MLDLKQLLESAPNRVVREVFGEGATAFEVELRSLSRSDVEAMRRKTTKRVLDRTTRQYRDELDLEKMREFLLDHCITGWVDLTYGKVVALCNRELPASNKDLAKQEVTFTTENAGVLLRDAIGFEDWVWQQVTTRADEVSAEEADSKNV